MDTVSEAKNLYQNVFPFARNGARSGAQRIVLLMGSGKMPDGLADKVVEEALELLTNKVTLYMVSLGAYTDKAVLDRFVFPSNFIPVVNSDNIGSRAVPLIVRRMNAGTRIRTQRKKNKNSGHPTPSHDLP